MADEKCDSTKRFEERFGEAEEEEETFFDEEALDELLDAAEEAEKNKDPGLMPISIFAYLVALALIIWLVCETISKWKWQ